MTDYSCIRFSSPRIELHPSTAKNQIVHHERLFFLVGNETHFSFNHTYGNAGHFNVSALVYNNHSYDAYGHVKYEHNHTQMIHVQKRVENWTFEADDYWIRDNGCKRI